MKWGRQDGNDEKRGGEEGREKRGERNIKGGSEYRGEGGRERCEKVEIGGQKMRERGSA